MNIIFFGSFQHYSTLILQALHEHPKLQVVGVVTTPPMPAGRKQILTKTDVHLYAESHSLPVFTPNSLQLTPDTILLPKVDYFIVAGYGKILPSSWLSYPKNGSLNLHFSQLPKYRGANPAEWAILLGESETGITLIQMNEGIDAGSILAKNSLQIEKDDTRVSLYEKLYTLGARMLPQWILSLPLNPLSQSPSPTPYAAKFSRDEGYIDWRIIDSAIQGTSYSPDLFPKLLNQAYVHVNRLTDPSINQPAFIERAIRALYGYPGVWTFVQTSKGRKRMKILSTKLEARNLKLLQVQLEGYSPTSFNQIKNLLV